MQGDTKTLIKRFCMESTVLGLKYLYIYPDVASRIFWIVNIAFAYVVAAVISFNLYCRFIEIPTRITIENQYEPLINVSLPSITLCSPTQITTEGMARVAEKLNTHQNINLDVALKLLFGNAEFDLTVSPGDMDELNNLLNKNHYIMNDIIMMMSQKCEDFLKLCSFGGKLWECKRLFHPVLTKRGLCCTFNNVYYLSDENINKKNTRFKSMYSSDFNWASGLQVVADFEPTKAMNRTILNAGLMWLTYNQHEEFPSDDQLVLVHGNTEVLNSVQITYTYCSDDVRQLPAWSRKCYFADDEDLPYFGKYHNDDCDSLCLITAVKETCGCLLYYVPSARPDQICNFSQLMCISTTRDNIGEFYTADRCACARNCEAFSYNVDAVVGNLDGTPHMLYQFPIPLNQSSTLIWFFMPQAVYKKQKQETTMSITTAIANLGGVFGLCLGCSVVTFFEVIFYTYSAIKNRSQAKHKIRPITPQKYVIK